MRQVHPSRQPGDARGFTLIELVIAIVVVAVLTSVALPAFFDSIRKSRRSEGIAALSAVQQAQERWRANSASYTTNLTALPTDTTPGLGLPATTPSNYYTVSIVSADNTSYEATATAIGGTSQANDLACGKMGVKMTGGNLKFAGTSLSGSLTYGAQSTCWGR